MPTENTEYTKRSDYKSLMFEQRKMSEIDQKPNPISGGVKVILNLGSMFVDQPGCRLQLDDYFVETNEIREIMLVQCSPLVREAKRLLRHKGNGLKFKLNGQAFLVYCLKETTSLVFVDFKARPQNPISLFFVQQASPNLSRCIRHKIIPPQFHFPIVPCFPWATYPPASLPALSIVERAPYSLLPIPASLHHLPRRRSSGA